MTSTPRVALTIAGSDSSGGAGIQADLRTFNAFRVHGASAITALTAQNTQGVSGIHPVPPAFVSQQIDAVTSDMRIAAIKIGMLANASIIDAVAASLESLPDTPLVLDPVMVATTGARLIEPDAVQRLRRQIIPMATLITPNLDEAALLASLPKATSQTEIDHQARILLAEAARAVLIKGGHAGSDESADTYMSASEHFVVSRPRIPTPNTHGTGCTLSAAIVAGLALERPMRDAIEAAKDFVWKGLKRAQTHRLGRGPGPLDLPRRVP